ncbi:hypothetical protein [Streptomyces xanthophaeus]|uniref:hypothetical protein n=1 Tax=Streptomyces xanthophaeus TaxID=67385 RepID=UPI0012FF1FBC|nr:hypothetical protein [Streptomyces xanthophaeus]
MLVRFGDPVTAGQPDFTADAMTAIPHPSGEGLYIPNMDIADEWDRADPIAHTEMVLEVIDKTENTFARAVRLLKHWNCTHSKPLCSWNIKALALESITTPMPLIDALQTFFAHAAREFKSGQTQDPSGVAGPYPPQPADQRSPQTPGHGPGLHRPRNPTRSRGPSSQCAARTQPGQARRDIEAPLQHGRRLVSLVSVRS